MTQRLLILACSATKNPAPGEFPAVDRYRPGAYYQILHGVPRDRWPDIIILSARFGFIAGEHPIMNYDTRMTQQLADGFKVDPATRKALQTMILPNHQDIFIAAGKTYREVINAFPDLFPERATITAASGGIGQQRSQLKSWLSSCSPERSSP